MSSPGIHRGSTQKYTEILRNLVNNGEELLATFRNSIARASINACIDIAHLYGHVNDDCFRD